MVSPFPSKTPIKNYEDVELTSILENAQKNRLGMLRLQQMSPIQRMFALSSNIQQITELALNDTSMTSLLNSGRKFDLIIQNWFFNQAHLGIAKHFGAPVIAFSTSGALTSTNRVTNNPSPYSYAPFILSSYPTDMTFFQRLGNTFMYLFFELLETFVNEPAQERLLQKYFPKAPPLQDLINNVSLVMLNSHFSIENPRPYVPNMVQIGGLHLEDPESLDEELKMYLDSATDGAAFFSLGSNIKVSDLPEEKLQGIIKAFEKLSPLKVLWKFEADDVPKLPGNVRVGKWLPQREILAHANTKVFVTHGGMLSTIEAVYHGVPMVGMPNHADQHYNVADAVSNGYAVKVSVDELSESTLTSAITEILNNPKYRKNIQVRSKALRDQPMKPIDKAIYWVEYVLRHRGAAHLKTSAFKLKWYQYYLLDVFAFIIGVLAVTLWVTCKILKLVLKLLGFGRAKKTKTD